MTKFFIILLLLFGHCSSDENAKQEKFKPQTDWITFKQKSPCEKINIISKGENVSGLFMDSIAIDMYKITNIAPSFKLGTAGATYTSVTDFKSDVAKWKFFLNCKWETSSLASLGK